MEIYAQKMGMGCVTEGKSRKESNQETIGAGYQVGPADNMGSGESGGSPRNTMQRNITERGIWQWMYGERRGRDLHKRCQRGHRKSVEVMRKR